MRVEIGGAVTETEIFAEPLLAKLVLWAMNASLDKISSLNLLPPLKYFQK